MKQVHGNSLISGAATFVLLAAQPVWAQTTTITDVQLNPVDGGISVVLKASAGNRPQVFTTKKGKALVSDIINTQLRLPQGNSFRKEEPAPGIALVEISQLDGNSIRVTVTGSNNIPSSQGVVRKQDGITLGFTPSTDTTASAPTTPTATKPPASTPVQVAQKQDVLVPNPEVTIDGRPAQPAGIGQPYNQAPPFLPRAVAPPVGDISIATTDASPSNIDLGTQERVPRLVLRDAPVREVLSLLARAAGMNLAYIGGEGAQPPGGQPIPGNSTPTISQTISLDIENEPVQDVFNYVLRLSGLEANRSGRTIFVGAKLPNSTRDVVMRNLRLNQVTVGVALNFLVGLGAESAISRERLVTSVNAVAVGAGAAPITQTQTTTETKLETQRAEFKDSNPLLRGIQALGDERTNSVTLIGSPRLLDIAVAQLTQLDIRRRQVVVNVKIVDINLTNTDEFSTSFSFGVGDNFFSSSGGVANVNTGRTRPPTTTEINNSLTSAPTIDDPAGDFTNPVQFSRNFLSQLQATVTNGNAKILTDPSLIVQEGQTANVNLTQEVIGKFTTTTTDNGSGVLREVSEVTKEKIGLTVAVKIERIDDNGFVALSVAPIVKAVGNTATTGDGEIALISERSLNSGIIRLRDGQTLILSGIIQDEDRTSISKIPILGDIPLIGALFRSTTKNNLRKEVIVLLTPQIMDDTQNSAYGYNYTPSPQVRQIFERRGLKAPGKQ
ncbi:AMIN domain-containing protein [Cylindrospermum sp. FACHB-282]|uniref:AMIN domain-containing protein n=1 Tax=Cylindrospermum sp. FACHB-282 TaxID=2692794 RepID=UPI001686E64B|nr:AMIN domain-containing protein [Cylindrospermum sp. FACHB-282]MBD2387755.1 AMIN domain-containing protein [Cylindrospermum sp. FACHB-282]